MDDKGNHPIYYMMIGYVVEEGVKHQELVLKEEKEVILMHRLVLYQQQQHMDQMKVILMDIDVLDYYKEMRMISKIINNLIIINIIFIKDLDGNIHHLIHYMMI